MYRFFVFFFFQAEDGIRDLTVTGVQTCALPISPKRHIDGFVSQNRIVATMFSIFGLVAMVIAGVGIYGVMTFSVSQRTQELGVRMALGADSRRILRMVLRQGSILTGIGMALGLL